MTGVRVDRSVLDELRDRFLAGRPDFRSFAEPGTGQVAREREFKVAAAREVQTAVADGQDDETLGREVFEILKKHGSLVHWRTEGKITSQQPELLGEFRSVLGRLVRSDLPAGDALAQASRAFEALKERGAKALSDGVRLNILFSALAMVRPGEAAPLKIGWINETWERLTGEKLFVPGASDMAPDYRRFAVVFSELFGILRDEWQWQPQDWFDVQGFLWISHDRWNSASAAADASSSAGTNREKPMAVAPENLILHGPPGTGKTYRTTEEAVRLCGEAVPEDRQGLERTYRRLVAARRIEFVTFHQSMSYEEFVEGRQPTTGSGDDGDASSTGFRLETVPGIFRLIAERAEASRDRSTGESADGPAAPEQFVLIIDEINRANISKVFGELITLLEPDKRLGQRNALTVRLPYSRDEFGVPSNLHILGTMNTADRSIALLDTALRRRFSFREMMPEPGLLDEAAGRCGLPLPEILRTMNRRIEYLHDREHQIGHAYFMECTSRADVDEVMRNRVIPLLAEYFFEDREKVAAVLGDAVPGDAERSERGGFLDRLPLETPPGLDNGDGQPRWSWELRSEDDGFDYSRLIGA